MWLPRTDFLLKPNAQGHSILIAQLWHELLSTSSPDSFRAKALDLPLLMEELLRICRYAQQEPKWLSHVRLICEEIKSHQLVENIGTVPSVLESTLDKISGFTSGIAELPRLVEQVQVFLDLYRPYVSSLAQHIHKLVSVSKEKKVLEAYMSMLATHVQANGAGDEHVANIDDSLCELSPEDVVVKLCGHVDRPPREFSCFVEIFAPRPVASSLFSGLPFKEVNAKAFGADPIGLAWNAERQKGIAINWMTKAPSRLKAAELVLEEVLSLIHLHALYSNNVMISASPRVLIRDDGQFHVIDVTPSRHFGLQPRQDAERLSRERYKKLGNRLSGRLANVLESHALAVSANDSRSAVFHLWTALETLASGLGSGSIGEGVADVVAPIVVGKRINKIATYLAISGHELQKHTGVAYDFSHMPRSSSRGIDRSDILKAISGVRDNHAVLSSFQNFAPSPLLTYRLYRAWEECHDPLTLRSVLLMSQKRIKWQVMRFYRARNLLVHHGEVDNLAARLLEDAQYYLSTCVERVLHDFSDYPTWEVNTSLEFQRHRFEGLLKRMESKPSEVKLGELLVNALPTYVNDLVWPHGHTLQSKGNKHTQKQHAEGAIPTGQITGNGSP